MKVIRWLFMPSSVEYETNWSEQVYNRMWIIICCIVNPITLCAFGVWCGISKNVTLGIVGIISMGCLFGFNIVQLFICENKWGEESRRLYASLHGGKVNG